MIALNEILKNKDKYIERYKLMDKNVNLDKIISLEQKFIIIDDRKNQNRAKCNKLCSQVAEIINNDNTPQDLIKQINKLDKYIRQDEIKSKRAMAKINRHLSKLPNIALDKNTLNLVLKSQNNKEFNISNLIGQIPNISIEQNINIHRYLKTLKNRVLKLEELPQSTQFDNKKGIEILMLLDINARHVFENLNSILVCNAQHVIDTSIKQLDKNTSKQIIALLNDNTRVELQYVGEYISRSLNIKYYDKTLDMTRFVNIIKIKIKRHEQ